MSTISTRTRLPSPGDVYVTTRRAYSPVVTSYDYDAPLSESGAPGPKYHAFREVIARHAPVPDQPEPPPAPKLPGTGVEFKHRAPLLPYAHALSESVRTELPATMDELDVADESKADGATVVQYRCGAKAHQQWRFEERGDDTYRLVARHSGQCLDVADASKEDGARLVQRGCGDGASQRFERRAA